MDLTLYTATSGLFIAVPDCLRPSMEAEGLHGPLQFRARLSLDDDPACRLSVRLATEIEGQCYAVLSAREGQRLLRYTRARNPR